ERRWAGSVRSSQLAAHSSPLVVRGAHGVAHLARSPVARSPVARSPVARSSHVERCTSARQHMARRTCARCTCARSTLHAPRRTCPHRSMLRATGRIVLAVVAFGLGCIVYIHLPLPDVRSLRTSNPDTTAFIELRAREARARGDQPKRVQRWVSYGRISQHL